MQPLVKKSYHIATYMFWSLLSFTVTAYVALAWFAYPPAQFVSANIFHPFLSTIGALPIIQQTITFDGFLGIFALAGILLGTLFARDAYLHLKYSLNSNVPYKDKENFENEKYDYYALAKARRFASWIFLSAIFSFLTFISFAAIAHYPLASFVVKQLFVPILSAFQIVPAGTSLNPLILISMAAIFLSLAILSAIPCGITMKNWLKKSLNPFNSLSEDENSHSVDLSAVSNEEISEKSTEEAGQDANFTPSLDSNYESLRQVARKSDLLKYSSPLPPYPGPDPESLNHPLNFFDVPEAKPIPGLEFPQVASSVLNVATPSLLSSGLPNSTLPPSRPELPANIINPPVISANPNDIKVDFS